MIRAAFIACALASPAAASDVRIWHSTLTGGEDSSVRMHAPTVVNAVATVTFKNTTVHSADETFSLHYDGLSIEVIFDWQVNDTQAESITILPPQGYIAIPDVLVVDEDQSGEAQIVPYWGG